MRKIIHMWNTCVEHSWQSSQGWASQQVHSKVRLCDAQRNCNEPKSLLAPLRSLRRPWTSTTSCNEKRAEISPQLCERLRKSYRKWWLQSWWFYKLLSKTRHLISTAESCENSFSHVCTSLSCSSHAEYRLWRRSKKKKIPKQIFMVPEVQKC